MSSKGWTKGKVVAPKAGPSIVAPKAVGAVRPPAMQVGAIRPAWSAAPTKAKAAGVSAPLVPGRLAPGTQALAPGPMAAKMGKVVAPKAAVMPVMPMIGGIAVPPGGSLKRKLKDAPEVCWDFVKKGSCIRGDSCKWSHEASRDEFDLASAPATKKQKTNSGAAAPKQGSGIKGRTDEDRAKAKEDYAVWRDERITFGTDTNGANASSLDWWYAQVCLVCLAECDLAIYQGHRKSHRHLARYKEVGGASLLPGVLRPEPNLVLPLQPPNMDKWLSVSGFTSGGSILALGEQDYSFSLSIAQKQMAATQQVRLVATSYLAAHDPSEPEVHVRDDGLRSTYSRKSLPSMEGALDKNIQEIQYLGGTVLHSVDATDLLGTLYTQKPDALYDIIVFPFPRASLRRGVDPSNPRLIRNFFRSVQQSLVLNPGGVIELVLLRSQYGAWDIACMGLEAGFKLLRHTALPENFYQSREMSGKTWTPKDAEIYVFGQV